MRWKTYRIPSEVIETALSKQGWTRKQLSSEAEVSQAWLSKVFAGEPVREEELQRLCSALKLDFTQVVERETPEAGFPGEIVSNASTHYELLQRQLADAERQIVMVGTGVEGVSQRIRSIIRLLARRGHDLEVIRIEASRGRRREEWIKEVALYLTHLDDEESPTGIRLFVPVHRKSFQVRDCCVTDADMTSNTVSMEFPWVGTTGPGPTYFNSGVAFARSSASWVENLARNEKVTVRITSAEQLLKRHGLDPQAVLPSREPERELFVYGLDLAARRFLGRAPDAEFVGLARCDGYRPGFARRRDALFGGCPMTLLPDGDRRTPAMGCVYRISEFDQTRMDFYHSLHDHFQYEPSRISVRCLANGREELMPVVSFLVPNPEEPLEGPDQSYRDLIIEALDDPTRDKRFDGVPSEWAADWLANKRAWQHEIDTWENKGRGNH